LASELGFIALADTLAVAEAVVATQRDHGNRINRRNAKTKYTLDNFGLDNFKYEVEKRTQVSFQPTKPYELKERGDRIGWIKGVDNLYHLTLFIGSGRLVDSEEKRQKAGIAAIAKIHRGDLRLTPNQNLIIAGVSAENKAAIDALVSEYHLIDDQVTLQRKHSMACVSHPTCPLAMAEAERVIDQFSARIDELLAKYNIAQKSIIFRVTGCPNGCGRAMLAEIGLVGRALGRYDLYFGGNRQGTRIPRLYKSNLSVEDIFSAIEAYIQLWSKSEFINQDFGNFMVQSGHIVPVVNSPQDFHQ
jgi:sulfite reductase (NADPH) hemoprotein beta-component